jgi:DNA polymerase-3 subunit beta
MKATITRDQLQQGLQQVLPAIGRGATLPISACVLLEADPKAGVLRLYGTDLDVAVGTMVPASIDEKGMVVVPARDLLSIAKELPSAAVKLTFLPETDRLEVKCGRSTIRLVTLAANDFPTLPAMDFKRSWKIIAGELAKMVEKVAFAASREESRPILNGVCWELHPKRMRMVATNGHRLCMIEVATPTEVEKTKTLIVPPKTLALVNHLFGPEDEVQIACTENHIGFRTATTQLVSRLIGGPYPSYEQVIPKEFNREATVDVASLTATLRRAAIVASRQTHRVVLTLSATRQSVRVSTPDRGDSREGVTMHYEGDPLELGFNAGYLLDMLKHIPTDDVRLRLIAAERAVVFEPIGFEDGKYTCLVMPLRIDDVAQEPAESIAEGDKAA